MPTKKADEEFRNAMVDLETMGTSPGCSILAIGAVQFGQKGLGREFYTVVSAQSCLDAGLRVDEQTLKWWMGQSKEAQAVLRQCGLKKAPPLEKALRSFREFCHGTSVDLRVWGNGADFDNPILKAAYEALGWTQPWPTYNGRCYRTLKSLAPKVKMEREGTHHNALDDAKSQARHAVALAHHLGVEL